MRAVPNDAAFGVSSGSNLHVQFHYSILSTMRIVLSHRVMIVNCYGGLPLLISTRCQDNQRTRPGDRNGQKDGSIVSEFLNGHGSSSGVRGH
jgi:hypothetical protein